MRFLHTSDWHLGRSLHRADLREAQERFLGHLVETARAEKVDAVLISGDVYDRAIPPLDAVKLFEEALGRLRDTGARVILISGNHDSARRLGFGAELIDKAGVHLRTRLDSLATPVLLDDHHGPVAVYGIPYTEPALALPLLGGEEAGGVTAGAREAPAEGHVARPGHQAVLGEAAARIAKDAATRGLMRTVVLAHAWVIGGEASESERDIRTERDSRKDRDGRVGGIGDVPASVFDGFSYVALGHLHGQQTLASHVRYSGSPLPYSFSEARHRKATWLVELGDAGQVAAVSVPAPVFKRLSVLAGRLGDLLTSREYTEYEPDFLAVTLTDVARPDQAMDRLRKRFRHVLTLDFKPEGVARRRPVVRTEDRREGRPGCRGRVRQARAQHRGYAGRAGPAGGGVRGSGRFPERRRVLMRLHRLRVQAFGAFAGTEEVGFDELDGLFLLHGDTGAGKTTLLDAIAFALYGRVPGVRGDAKRLRSDHAASDVRTEVQLEATVGGRRLRIIRKPEQIRPRKSGTGFTTEPASILLEEMTAAGAWEGKSPRVGEADAEIRDLIGMSAEQFFQVVLLPQGQFAKFLHSDAKDRAALLQSLFGTDRFERVEKWLAERRVSTIRDVEVASAAVDQLMALVAQAAGVAKPDGPGPGDDGSAADGSAADGAGEAAGDALWQVAWAEALVESARGTQEDADSRAAGHASQLDAAMVALLAAEQLAGKQRRKQEALRRQASLREVAPAIEALRGERDAASRAAEVAPVLHEADRRRTADAKARTAAERARSAVPADSAAASGEELRAGAKAQQERLGRLEALRSVASQAAHEDRAAAGARKRAGDLEAMIATSHSDSGRHRDARPVALHRRHTASQAAEDLPAAKVESEARRPGWRPN